MCLPQCKNMSTLTSLTCEDMAGSCPGLYSLTVLLRMLLKLEWKNVSTPVQKHVYPDITHVLRYGSPSAFQGVQRSYINLCTERESLGTRLVLQCLFWFVCLVLSLMENCPKYKYIVVQISATSTQCIC